MLGTTKVRHLEIRSGLQNRSLYGYGDEKFKYLCHLKDRRSGGDTKNSTS